MRANKDKIHAKADMPKLWPNQAAVRESGRQLTKRSHKHCAQTHPHVHSWHSWQAQAMAQAMDLANAHLYRI